MATITENAPYATFVNVFRCKPEDQAEVVRILAAITDQVGDGSPGFISASTHRSTDGTRVFNYLQWESREHLAAMQRSARFRELARGFRGLMEFEQHECEVVHVRESGAPEG